MNGPFGKLLSVEKTFYVFVVSHAGAEVDLFGVQAELASVCVMRWRNVNVC